MPRKYLSYDPRQLICQSHLVKFIMFSRLDWYGYKTKSHGCPICVGLIRAKVALEINRFNKGLNNAQLRTGKIDLPTKPVARGIAK